MTEPYSQEILAQLDDLRAQMTAAWNRGDTAAWLAIAYQIQEIHRAQLPEVELDPGPGGPDHYTYCETDDLYARRTGTGRYG